MPSLRHGKSRELRSAKPARLSPSAESDLEGIALYIGSPKGFDNPALARTLIAELRAKCDLIARRPRAYRLRPELGRDVRQALHKRYLILFRERAKEVRIERFIHSARDMETALRPHGASAGRT